MSPEVEEKLKKELQDPEGFRSCKEVQVWLKALEGIEMSYQEVHQVVRYRLKAKLKVPRPVHVKQEAGAREEFKKKPSTLIEEGLSKVGEKREKYKRVRYWCEDETRVGLITKRRKKLTAKGIQPVGVEQWCFDYSCFN